MTALVVDILIVDTYPTFYRVLLHFVNAPGEEHVFIASTSGPGVGTDYEES